MDISKNITSIREDKRIKQFEIAQKLNVEPSNYSRLEKRGEKLTIEQLRQIAEALGVSINELLGEPIQPKDNEKVKDLEKRVLELEEKTELQRQLLEEKNEKLDKAYDIYSLYILHVFLRFGNFLAWDKLYGERDKNGVLPIILSNEELKKIVSENLVEYMIKENDWLLNVIIRDWNGDKRLKEYYNQNEPKIKEGQRIRVVK